MDLKKLNKKWFRFFCYVFFVLYLIILMNVLFFSDYYGRTIVKNQYTYNFVPFQEIKRFIRYRHLMTFEEWTTNLFGNVLAFIPLGFFLPAISRVYRKFYKVIISSFLVSLSVELLQLYYKVGIFDVDDLLLNTLGGVVGYICFKIMYGIYQRRKRISGE